VKIFLEFRKAENVDFVSTLLDSYVNFRALSWQKGKETEEQRENIVEDVVEIVRIYVSMFVFVGVHDDEFCSQFT